MLKACSSCGRIHDSKYLCEHKIKEIRNRQKKKYTKQNDFRGTKAWKNKRKEIKERDCFCCQVCIRELYDAERKYETENISVHHAIPIEQDYDRRLDNDNLISLCQKHHEMAESGEIPYEIVKAIIDEQEKSPPGELSAIFH